MLKDVLCNSSSTIFDLCQAKANQSLSFQPNMSVTDPLSRIRAALDVGYSKNIVVALTGESWTAYATFQSAK